MKLQPFDWRAATTTYDVNPMIEAKMEEIRRAVSFGIEKGIKQQLAAAGWISPEMTEEIKLAYTNLSFRLNNQDGYWYVMDEDATMRRLLNLEA